MSNCFYIHKIEIPSNKGANAYKLKITKICKPQIILDMILNFVT